MDSTDRINALLDEAYSSDDAETIERLVKKVLDLDEDNPEALILLSDVTEDFGGKIPMLEHARRVLEEELQEYEFPDDECCYLDDELGALYVSALVRLAFAYFSEGRNDEALALSRIVAEYDPERETPGKTLLYRLLLEKKEYGKIIEESLKELETFPAMLHSLAIATFKLSGAGERAYKALWSAFAADPDAPFYMLGYLDEPEEDADDETIESFNLAMLYEDAWLSPEDTPLANWLASAAILLGLAASIFPHEDIDNMLVLADALGIADHVEDVLIKLESGRDWGGLSDRERMVSAIKFISGGLFIPKEV